MSDLATYLAQDRRRALANGGSLPDRAHGSVLFADISGFTPLTETLRKLFGSRRGAEELTNYLEAVYTALIGEVERYGGWVIGFAGDGITCWFGGEGIEDNGWELAARAVACGLALQEAMQAFAAITLSAEETVALRLKVAIATGEVRRLVVGDSQYGFLDTLAGETVNRTAVGEYLANRGDILVDSATAHTLGEAITLHEWRTDAESQTRYGVVKRLTTPLPLPNEPEPAELDDEQLRPWVHPTIYAREQAGTAVFSAEFRPCVAFFIRFTGIDYDSDQAGVQLDGFIQQVQRLAAQYEGTLLHLIIGDKGSYLYLNFGALSAHEDEARRAVKTATAVREMAQKYDWLNPLQMGLAQGVMWVGTYGGATRRTYSAFGDDVNLAARLMQAAVGGEILATTAVHKSAGAHLLFAPHPPVTLKGKSEPIPVLAVIGEQSQRTIRLLEPTYALPMVGRQAELQRIQEKLSRAQQGQAQIVGIVAEAGLGKSRLVAEGIRLARQSGFAGYGGACQSDGLHTPYLAWKPIGAALLQFEPSAPHPAQIEQLAAQIGRLAPARQQALPLLAPLLGVTIPDNEFTHALEPKIRQSALSALLEDCLKTAAANHPLLIVIEDLHWLDALSHDLLENLAKGLVDAPICFLLAYRPPELARLQLPRLESLPYFHKIELAELSGAEAEQLVQAKFTQLYPHVQGVALTSLTDKLMARTQGNPFYLEELLNFLHDQQFDPQHTAALEQIELPDSLHALILSRIDQLTEREKTTLRVASVIGRLFSADWLVGYYPELGRLPHIKSALDKLHTLDITPQDTPEPELAYLFKHIVTHEVTYESLPFATRARLHEQLAHYLEATYAENPPLDVLAFHYGRSDNVAKQKEYLRKAGEAAQKNYANDAALNFYGRLLPLVETEEQIALQLKLGDLYVLIGEWGEAEKVYRAALALAEQKQELKAQIDGRLALGRLFDFKGEPDEALLWLQQAHRQSETAANGLATAEVLIAIGYVYQRRGMYTEARNYLQEGLKLAQSWSDARLIARATNYLGLTALYQSNYPEAQRLLESCLALQQQLADKHGIAQALNDLGGVAFYQGNYALAQTLHEQAVVLRREMGNKGAIAGSLSNLTSVATHLGQYEQGREYGEQSLLLRRQLGDKWGIANVLNNLGTNATHRGEIDQAEALFTESLHLWQEMGDEQGVADTSLNLADISFKQGNYERSTQLYGDSLRMCAHLRDELGIAYVLIGLGNLGLVFQHIEQAAVLASAATSLLHTLHVTLNGVEQDAFDHALGQMRAELGDTLFQSAWAEGEQMDVAQAVAYALQEIDIYLRVP